MKIFTDTDNYLTALIFLKNQNIMIIQVGKMKDETCHARMKSFVVLK